MNYWAYIAVFFIGFTGGMVSLWFIIRDKISSKSIHIGKNKQRGGPGNQQDLDLEFEEAQSGADLTKREERQERRNIRKLKNKKQ